MLKRQPYNPSLRWSCEPARSIFPMCGEEERGEEDEIEGEENTLYITHHYIIYNYVSRRGRHPVRTEGVSEREMHHLQTMATSLCCLNSHRYNPL